MLVVICAIRKMVECVFSKRELRLLDDLLPESNKQRRRASHKPGLRKFRKKDRGIEEIDDNGGFGSDASVHVRPVTVDFIWPSVCVRIKLRK